MTTMQEALGSLANTKRKKSEVLLEGGLYAKEMHSSLIGSLKVNSRCSCNLTVLCHAQCIFKVLAPGA